MSQESQFSHLFCGKMENHNIANDKSETHIGTKLLIQRPGQVDKKSDVDCATPSTPHPVWLWSSDHDPPILHARQTTKRTCPSSPHNFGCARSLTNGKICTPSKQAQTLAAALFANPRRSRPLCRNAHNQQHRSGNRTCEASKTETEGRDQKGRTE